MALTFPSHPDLAKEVTAYLEARDIAPTTFGEMALGDPSLIATLSNGRELRRKTLERVRMFMLTGKQDQDARQ